MTDKHSQETQRISIPKGLRFEVFKRDSFKCQYCGASAPEVILNVDHIKPVADGGTNDITNLITSCIECNAGKSDKKLDDNSALTKRKALLDDLQERREQLEMMMQWMMGLQDLKSQIIEILANYWNRLAPGFEPNDRGRQSMKRWTTRFSIEEIMKAMDVSAIQYLQFKDNGGVTGESWEIAFSKIFSIMNVERDSKDDPDLKELLYIRGILRNKCKGYFNAPDALEWLRSARSWEIPISNLKQLACGVHNWNDYIEKINSLIDEWRDDS
jgi:hypothetical protein